MCYYYLRLFMLPLIAHSKLNAYSTYSSYNSYSANSSCYAYSSYVFKYY